jgi:DNA (cytosine-5)-methyltransferase 1
VFEPGALVRLDKAAWEDQSRTLRSHMGDNQAAVAYAVPIDMRNAVRNGGNQGTGVGEDGDAAFTVTAEYQHGVALIENHANDSRYKLCEDGVAPTLNARMGLGGGNVDLCVEVKPLVLAERKHAAPVTEDIVGSIVSTDYKGAPCVFEPKATYNICSDASNSMRSGNPDSGIYETDTARTLDRGGGSPSCNQGGTVICLEGNGQRPSHKGSGIKEDVSFTLDTVQQHAVCYQDKVSPLTTELAHQTGSHGQVGGQLVVEKEPCCYQETVGALCASDYRGIRNQDIGDDKAVVETFGNNGFGKWNAEPATLKANGGDFPGAENVVVENRKEALCHYAVRRLTPLECLRLQGFPDYWLSDIHIAEPTAEQLDYWRSAWTELGKKKSDNQLKKWLADPYGDSPAYKAIGNSLAVPCALFVLRGIVYNAR